MALAMIQAAMDMERQLRIFDSAELRVQMTMAKHGMGVMVPNKQECHGCPLELYTATYTHYLRTCNDCSLSRLEAALKSYLKGGQ